MATKQQVIQPDTNNGICTRCTILSLEHCDLTLAGTEMHLASMKLAEARNTILLIYLTTEFTRHLKMHCYNTSPN